MQIRSQAWLWCLLAVGLVAVGLYWPGLNGPFLLDDRFNFQVIHEWLQGEASLRKAIFGHQSLVYARPVAMASFALNAGLGGDGAFPFKLGNLLVHLACGALIWKVSLILLGRDRRLSAMAQPLALIVTALWLLHPLHVSTVLYAVQRMAQLASLFCLAAVWAYLAGRQRLGHTTDWRAIVLLFFVFPACVLLGVLSKQNAAVAPALCMLVELAYFTRDQRQWRVVAPFFGVFLILPVMGVAALLMVRPLALLGGYDDYDFGLSQRLMTQARVLVSYLGQIILPRAPMMGLYTDDVEVSTGLLTPASTILSIALIASLSSVALGVRRAYPTVFAGWFFFLVAHLVESSFLPLDLYFEHRNYLPMVGILWALVALITILFARVPSNVLSRPQLSALLVIVVVASLSFATLGRVLVWQQKDTLIEQGIRYHPGSLRAQLDMAALARDRRDWTTYSRVMEQLVSSEDPRSRLLGNLYLFSLACEQGRPPDPALMRDASAVRLPSISYAETHAFNVLLLSTRDGCKGVSQAEIADMLRSIADAAVRQSPDRKAQWLTRHAVANQYARAGDWDRALEQSILAWQPNADPGVGALLAQLQAKTGDFEAARRTMTEVAAGTRCHDHQNLTELGHLWVKIAQMQPGGLDAHPLPELACRR